MLKQLILGAGLTVLVSMPTIAYAQQAQGITVTGKATIEKAPDQFVINVTVSNRSSIVQKAKASVDIKSEKITNMAKRYGIAAKDIRSTQLQISPIYPRRNHRVEEVYVADRDVVAKVPVSNKEKENLSIEFEVTRSISLTLQSFDNYEKILDRLTKIGVTRISPVQTSISDAETLYQKALTQAVANAKSKAEMLAIKLGVTLGRVNQLTEHAYRAPAKMMLAQESSMSSARHQSYTGVDSVSAEVTATFTIAE